MQQHRWWTMRVRLLLVSLVSLVLVSLAGPAAATTRYVHGTSGNDSNSCSTAISSTPSNAKRTIAGGLSCTQGGDTLIVRGGTGGSCIVYPESFAVGSIPNGTEGAHTTLQAFGGGHLKGGECVHIRPVDNLAPNGDVMEFIAQHHITIDGFKLDGGDTSTDLVGHAARKASFIIRAQRPNDSFGENHDIIVRNNEMMRSVASCAIPQGYRWEFSGNLVHHCGWFCCNSYGMTDSETGAVSNGDDHGFYFESRESIIRGNTFHHNPAYSIQVYGGDTGLNDNIIENNTFSTSRCGVTMQGSNNIFRNNVMYNDGHNENLGDFSGTGCGGGSTTSVGVIIDGGSQKIANNTFYGHRVTDQDNDCGSGCEVKNNIICNDGSTDISGTGSVSNNLSGTCPGFVNAGAGNFDLTSDDTGGTTLAYVTTDFLGRPRTAPYSRGAYEFSGTPAPPVATSLRFAVQPTTVAINTAISPAVQVEILDQFGAPMPTASAMITLSIGTNPGGATLTGGGATATTSGIATFGNLRLTAAGTDYRLTATAAPALTGATSDPFEVTETPTGCSSPCTIYVNPSALNDTQPCNTADLTHPRKTLAGGAACLTVPGSTLYLRAGTYNECLDTSVTPIVGGTSWAAPTTIAAYGTETVTLTLPPSCQAAMIFRTPAQDHYIVIDRLILDALNTLDSNGLVYYPGTHHLRFQNGVIKNTYWEGVYIQDATDTEVLNTRIDTSNWYGINIVDSSTRTLLQGLTITNHPQAGLQIENGSVFTARNLTLTGNGTGGAQPAVRVGGSGETGALLANAVIYENYAGIQVLTGTSGLKLYNNTLVNNTNAGVTVDSGVTNINLVNTISTGHGGGQNIVNNAGASVTQAAVLTTNPGFVDVALDDYHLAPTASTAINQGVTPAGLTTDVPTDRDGVPRPQGAGYDIGAYECPVPCTAAPPPSGGVQLTAPAWKSGGLLRR